MARTQRTQTTLYEKYGPEGIKAVVDEFYDRCLADPNVNYYFDGVDMHMLRMHQAAFVSYILGSPKPYTNAKLREAHKGLGIQEQDYEIILKHLDGAMKKFNLDLEDRAKILAIFRTFKAFIINQ